VTTPLGSMESPFGLWTQDPALAALLSWGDSVRRADRQGKEAQLAAETEDESRHASWLVTLTLTRALPGTTTLLLLPEYLQAIRLLDWVHRMGFVSIQTRIRSWWKLVHQHYQLVHFTTVLYWHFES